MSAHFAHSSHCLVEKVHRTLAGNVGEVANCSALATNKCRPLGTAAALKWLRPHLHQLHSSNVFCCLLPESYCCSCSVHTPLATWGSSMNYLRELSRRHDELKHKIHSFRIPLSPTGRRFMGFVYFCIPVIGGYFIMEVRSCLLVVRPSYCLTFLKC
jgi:hypothetical protein